MILKYDNTIYLHTYVYELSKSKSIFKALIGAQIKSKFNCIKFFYFLFVKRRNT